MVVRTGQKLSGNFNLIWSYVVNKTINKIHADYGESTVVDKYTICNFDLKKKKLK